MSRAIVLLMSPTRAVGQENHQNSSLSKYRITGPWWRQPEMSLTVILPLDYLGLTIFSCVRATLDRAFGVLTEERMR